MLVPLAVLLIPGLRVVPWLYKWRINQRIYRRYGELMALERAAFDKTTPEHWLNPAAFAQPALGTLGNFQRNSVRGPGYWSIDLAISRLVAFGAARKLELRVETFNLLNTFNWGPPTLAQGSDRTHTNFNSGAFGRITSMEGSPRIMQFGVKYGF